jgi:2-polyprenyl-6-methoxyphenol hydroxylase-like FAD-dependent oxidoreductase
MSGTSDYDIIIIGARIAGSILATILGERDYRVLVIDRTTFPSDTISTHFFRAPALRAFKQIGVFNEVQSVAPHLTVNYNVIDGIEFPEPVDRPDDYPFYMCVRRIILDDILVRRVKQIPSVELREGVRVKDLIWDNDYVKGIIWDDTNQKGKERAKIIIGADGINSFLAKEVNAQTEHNAPINRAMYYAYYRGIKAKDGPAAEFHYKENTLVYCFPCDNNLTLVAASIPIVQFATFKGNLETEFDNVLKSMVALAPRIQNAIRESPIRGSGNIPGYLRIPYGKGWALVGDSGMVMDPWSGQGMDQASTHALYLAKYLDNYLSGHQNWEAAMSAYHSDRNEFSLKTFQRTCTLSADLRPMTNAALKRRGLK